MMAIGAARQILLVAPVLVRGDQHVSRRLLQRSAAPGHRRFKTARGELDDRCYLFRRHVRPFDDLVGGGARFEILEDDWTPAYACS